MDNMNDTARLKAKIVELESMLAAMDKLAPKQRKTIDDLQSKLVSRTKEVDGWIKRYDKSVVKQRNIIQDVQAKLDRLEALKD